MQRIGRFGAGLVGVIGLIVLVGWYTQTLALTEGVPGLQPMRPTAAVSLILLSLSVVVVRRRAAVILAATTVVVGCVTIAGYAIGSTLGMSAWVPGIELGGQEPRMAPIAAVGLILLGVAVIAEKCNRTTGMQVFASASLIISLLAILGYVYGVSSLYTVSGFTSIALPAAASIVILSVAVLLQRPSVGLVGLLVDRGSAGKLIRRILPFLVFGPVFLGLFSLWGERAGWFDKAFGIAILITNMTVMGMALIWIAAVKLRELDTQRRGAMQALAAANGTLEETVAYRTRELGELAQELQTFIRIAPVGLVQMDSAGGLLAANDRWLALSGLTLGESLGDGWTRVLHPADADRVSGEWGAAVTVGSAYQATLRFCTPQGETNWVEVSTAPIHGLDSAAITGHLAIMTDITARRLAEARVEHLAFHDSLTDLPNRVLLLDRLNRALREVAQGGRWVAVLFIDLNGFKFVNDSLGHHAGDTVLVEVGNRLRLHVRSTDTVARLGGDEFVVICPDIGKRDVDAITASLLRVIAEPIVVGGQLASVDASIGIALGLGHDDAESLLRNADQAMYLAKGRGGARCEFFTDDLSGRIQRRLDTELALRHAVDRDEIETWFQPIVDLHRHTLVATEALARWRRPEFGLVEPEEFIAIAEEGGLISGIGTTVLEQACRAAARGIGRLAVSVNVSPRQFVQPDFGVTVKRILTETGLSPDRLWLELTESAVLEAIDSATRAFLELRGIGVRLAIDGFGTGSSSFIHLRSFTVDLLKIDRTFVRDIEHSDRDRAIVEGLLRLADSLDLDVVAGGIESVGQRDLLTNMGCRYGQGFLFSGPEANIFSGLGVSDAFGPRPHSTVSPT